MQPADPLQIFGGLVQAVLVLAGVPLFAGLVLVFAQRAFGRSPTAILAPYRDILRWLCQRRRLEAGVADLSPLLLLLSVGMMVAVLLILPAAGPGLAGAVGGDAVAMVLLLAAARGMFVAGLAADGALVATNRAAGPAESAARGWLADPTLLLLLLALASLRGGLGLSVDPATLDTGPALAVRLLALGGGVLLAAAEVPHWIRYLPRAVWEGLGDPLHGARGPVRALAVLAVQLRLTVLAVLLAGSFAPWGGAPEGAGPAGWVFGLCAFFGKFLLIGGVFGLFAVFGARPVRWRGPILMAVAVSFAAAGLLLAGGLR